MGDEDPPPYNIRLDDFAALQVIISDKVKSNERGIHWPSDFTRSGDLQLERANYGRAAIVTADNGSESLRRLQRILSAMRIKRDGHSTRSQIR